MRKTQEELMQREKEFWNATNDPEFFRHNMASDALAVINGSVKTRDDAVKSTEETPEKLQNVHFDNTGFVQISDDTAAVVYKGAADMGGRHYEAMITSVYAKRRGNWVLVLTTHAESPGPQQNGKQKQKEKATANSR